MAEETTQGTTGGRYLTKDYLVRNLQNFWSKIKNYITENIKDFATETYVNRAVDTAVDDKVTQTEFGTLQSAVSNKAEQSELDTLKNTVSDKADASALTALDTELTKALEGKVDKVSGKDLSEKNFTATYETKLNNLPNQAATETEDGWMSADDKVKLDNLVETAVKANPQDPSDLIRLGKITSYATNNEGHIILKFIRDTEHLKIYTPNSDRPIEKVSLKDQDKILFTNFQENDNDTLAVTIENPEGKKDENSWNINTYTSFNFYIESLTVENKKYKPFILKAKRISEEDLTKIQLNIIKVFES